MNPDQKMTEQARNPKITPNTSGSEKTCCIEDGCNCLSEGGCDGITCGPQRERPCPTKDCGPIDVDFCFNCVKPGGKTFKIGWDYRCSPIDDTGRVEDFFEIGNCQRSIEPPCTGCCNDGDCEPDCGNIVIPVVPKGSNTADTGIVLDDQLYQPGNQRCYDYKIKMADGSACCNDGFCVSYVDSNNDDNYTLNLTCQ